MEEYTIDTEAREKIQDVIDLLRTGTPPAVWGMTEEQWCHHKINKAVGELVTILRRSEGHD